MCVVKSGLGNAPQPVGARISGNAIYANGGIGINLVGGTEDAQGVTANDPGDGDTGPNNLQNYPVITSVEGGSFLSLQATLNSTPSTTFELDVYATPSSDATSYGEGQTFLGYLFVTTDASGNASFSGTIGTPVGIGQAITMTATDPEGNTSEFSAPVVVTTTSGDQVVTNTLDSGPGSLRQAILNVNAKTGGGKVVFGIPGSGPHTIRPISPLPLVTKTVRIDGYTQPGSSVNTLPFANGTNAVLKIEIDGTNLGSEHNGLCICGGNSVVRGLVVNRFGSVGIRLQTKGGNRVEGCFLGTDVAGMSQLGNYTGVMITDIGYNWIGGTTAAQRNVIAGNKRGVTIGGEASTKNEVQGNYIGTDASGSAPLGNDDAGVLLISAVSNTIGGFADRAANVISGSGRGSQDIGAGIQIQGSPDQKGQWNSVLGNLIGTNAAGDAQLANFMRGIVILSSRGNIIGGMERGEGNVISGCALSGVYLWGWGGDAVLGNRIGTDITGTKAIGNGEGIVVRASDSVSIGGADSACANIIAHNTGQGIRVEESESRVTIRRNSIFSNGGIGIDLTGGTEDSRGWTANDPGDADTGPNGLQNHPEIMGATGGDKLRLAGRLNSRPNTKFTVDFYLTPTSSIGGFGEGKEYLGCQDVPTDAFGLAPFNVTINKSVSAEGFITATATDSSGNTSEFSAPVAVTVTSVSPKDVLPRETALLQNYPNPFNPTTVISYQLPVVSDVKLVVFDLLGRHVAVLVNERKEAGYHDVTFEASQTRCRRIFLSAAGTPCNGRPGGRLCSGQKASLRQVANWMPPGIDGRSDRGSDEQHSHQPRPVSGRGRPHSKVQQDRADSRRVAHRLVVTQHGLEGSRGYSRP